MSTSHGMGCGVGDGLGFGAISFVGRGAGLIPCKNVPSGRSIVSTRMISRVLLIGI
jgi:hypothetical protein